MRDGNNDHIDYSEVLMAYFVFSLTFELHTVTGGVEVMVFACHCFHKELQFVNSIGNSDF